MWGIGRYLYSLEGVWVSLKDGKYIVDSEYARLDSTYEKMVFTLTGQAPPKATAHQRASMPPDAAAPDGQQAAADLSSAWSPLKRGRRWSPICRGNTPISRMAFLFVCGDL